MTAESSSTRLVPSVDIEVEIPHYGEILLAHLPELQPYLDEAPWVHDVMRPLAEAYTWKVDHSIRAALLAEKVGSEFMGLSHEQMRPLVEAMLTHDVGFAYLPEEIVNGGKLNEAQIAQMRRHSGWSVKAVEQHSQPAAYLVDMVHRQGRPGNVYFGDPDKNYHAIESSKFHPIIMDVLGISKLTTLCDVIDALRASDRGHYKHVFSKEETYNEIMKFRDAHDESFYETDQGKRLVMFAIDAWDDINTRFEQIKVLATASATQVID